MQSSNEARWWYTLHLWLYDKNLNRLNREKCLALFMTTSKVNWQLNQKRDVDWHVMHKLTQFHPRLCIWISPSKFANIYGESLIFLGRVVESKARYDIDDRSDCFWIWKRKLRKFTLNFTLADFPVLAGARFQSMKNSFLDYRFHFASMTVNE